MRLLEAPELDAGWDPARAAGALRAALEDPSVDVVLVTGVLTAEAARKADLSKPVEKLAPFICVRH